MQRNNIFNLLYQFNQINVIQFQKYTCYYVLIFFLIHFIQGNIHFFSFHSLCCDMSGFFLFFFVIQDISGYRYNGIFCGHCQIAVGVHWMKFVSHVKFRQLQSISEQYPFFCHQTGMVGHWILRLYTFYESTHVG